MVDCVGWEGQGFTGNETDTLLWSKSAALLGHFCSFSVLLSLHDLLDSLLHVHFASSELGVPWGFDLPRPISSWGILCYFASSIDWLRFSVSNSNFLREASDSPARPWVKGSSLGLFGPWNGENQEQGLLTWNLAVDRVAWSRLQPEQILMDISSS